MPRHKLLLADDSATIRKVVNLTFAEEGIEVVTVGDGDSALQRIVLDKPDIVLADIHMPGLNGYQLCERIRSNDETSKLPVMLLVGSFEPFDEAEAARVGANVHLTKPFQSIRQLVSQVKELIEPPAVESEDQAPVQTVVSEPETEIPDVQAAEAAANHASQEEPPMQADQPPDTTDIESLYNQSLEETVEIPRTFFDKGYGDVSADDHLIEAATPSSLEARTDDADVTEPLPSASYFQTVPEQETFAATAAEELPINDDSSEPFGDLQTQPLRPIGLDDGDLLDLPPGDSASAYTFDAPPAGNQISENAPVVNLSPELIEVIVQKVIDRLEEKRERVSDSAFG